MSEPTPRQQPQVASDNQTNDPKQSIPIVLLCCQTFRFGTSADCCGRKNAGTLRDFLVMEIKAQGLERWTEVRDGPCFGHCTQGPTLRWVGKDLFTQMDRQKIFLLLEDVRRTLVTWGIDITAPYSVDGLNGIDENPADLLPPI